MNYTSKFMKYVKQLVQLQVNGEEMLQGHQKCRPRRIYTIARCNFYEDGDSPGWLTANQTNLALWGCRGGWETKRGKPTTTELLSLGGRQVPNDSTQVHVALKSSYSCYDCLWCQLG